VLTKSAIACRTFLLCGGMKKVILGGMNYIIVGADESPHL